jgi:hypothetical protein
MTDDIDNRKQALLDKQRECYAAEPRRMPLYQALAEAMQAYRNSDGKSGWATRWANVVRELESYLPHGSGFDSDPNISLQQSKPDRIVVDGSFHKMDSNGYYSGWANFRVTVKPTFSGIDVDARGAGSADLNDYIAETYIYALREYVDINAAHLRVLNRLPANWQDGA